MLFCWYGRTFHTLFRGDQPMVWSGKLKPRGPSKEGTKSTTISQGIRLTVGQGGNKIQKNSCYFTPVMHYPGGFRGDLPMPIRGVRKIHTLPTTMYPISGFSWIVRTMTSGFSWIVRTMTVSPVIKGYSWIKGRIISICKSKERYSRTPQVCSRLSNVLNWCPRSKEVQGTQGLYPRRSLSMSFWKAIWGTRKTSNAALRWIGSSCWDLIHLLYSRWMWECEVGA